MASRFGFLALAAMLISLAGCAMCANPFDCQYAAYGSRLPRADMVNGRVGSILDPAGGGVLTTQETQAGEIYHADGEGAYQESSDQDVAESLPGTNIEMGDALSTDEPPSESRDALDMDFESAPALGTDEIDRAFDAIQDELSNTPVEGDQ